MLQCNGDAYFTECVVSTTIRTHISLVNRPFEKATTRGSSERVLNVVALDRFKSDKTNGKRD